MAQEENSDLGGTFSTLNINAMEFVPSFSFRPRSAAPTLEDDSSDTAAAAAVETLPSLTTAPPAAADQDSATITNNSTSTVSTPTTPPDQPSSLPPVLSISNDFETLIPSTNDVPAETHPADDSLNPILAEDNVGFDNDHTYATISTISDILAVETPDNAGNSLGSITNQ